MNPMSVYEGFRMFAQDQRAKVPPDPAPPPPERVEPLPFRRGRKAFRIASTAAYWLMLFSPVFLKVDAVYPDGDPYGGIECLLFGWFQTPIWYANLLLFFMWSQLKTEPRPVLWPGVVALGLALCLWVPALSPGPPVFGAWVWLGSIVLALIGSVLAIKRQSTRGY